MSGSAEQRGCRSERHLVSHRRDRSGMTAPWADALPGKSHTLEDDGGRGNAAMGALSAVVPTAVYTSTQGSCLNALVFLKDVC